MFKTENKQIAKTAKNKNNTYTYENTHKMNRQYNKQHKQHTTSYFVLDKSMKHKHITYEYIHKVNRRPADAGARRQLQRRRGRAAGRQRGNVCVYIYIYIYIDR